MNQIQCVHGNLKRSCQICDQIAEIESLRAKLVETQTKLAAAERDAAWIGELLRDWKTGVISSNEAIGLLFKRFASFAAIDAAMEEKPE